MIRLKAVKFIDVVIAVVWLVIVYVSAVAMSGSIKKELKIKRAEDACVKMWTDSGVDRIKIGKGAGTCWLKEKW